MTEKHPEDVSLCALFLMEAAKRTDTFFQFPPPSTQHTVRDASQDISAMSTDLISSGAVKENPRRTTPPFQDPSTLGMEGKASQGWIESVLQGGWEAEVVNTEGDVLEGEIDFEYELYHTT